MADQNQLDLAGAFDDVAAPTAKVETAPTAEGLLGDTCARPFGSSLIVHVFLGIGIHLLLTWHILMVEMSAHSCFYFGWALSSRSSSNSSPSVSSL